MAPSSRISVWRPAYAFTPRSVSRRNVRSAFIVLGLAAIVGIVLFVAIRLAGGSDARPTYVAHDPSLRTPGIYLYAAEPVASQPQGIVLFFGNDVGFWNPHRRMASLLARDGYAVAGIDIRPLLDALPTDSAERADSLGRRIASLSQRVYAELAAHVPPLPGDDPPCALPANSTDPASARATTPLILAGHSLGAELALWTGANALAPRVDGVLAISPGSRSHLKIAPSDLLLNAEPTEPGSYSVAAEISAIGRRYPHARIAIVRGTRDGLQRADPELLAAGGKSTKRFDVPFIGHSMKQVVIAIPIVRRALGWLGGN